ncbi:MAG: hypothetical protein AAGU32_10555 [Bacillota bacterium]
MGEGVAAAEADTAAEGVSAGVALTSGDTTALMTLPGEAELWLDGSGVGAQAQSDEAKQRMSAITTYFLISIFLRIKAITQS